MRQAMMRAMGGSAVAVVAVTSGAASAQSQTPDLPVDTAAPAQAAATPGAVDGRTVYDAAYFAQYAPATALQMVQRVPGFSIQETDQEVRGFGQAAGNVVINGQRPSSKTDTLATILSRIPADRVVRVELAPGEQFGAEYSTRSQVVNLVLSAAAGVSGTMTGVLRRNFTGDMLPGGGVSALVRRGHSTFNLSATITNERPADEGSDTITALPSGNLVEFRQKVNPYEEPTGAIAAAWEHNAGDNNTAHFNVRYAPGRFRLVQESHVVTGAGARREDSIIQRFNVDDYELGGDITRPFAGGGLKLIGLATRRDRDNREQSLVDIGPGLRGFSQNIADQLDERLGRVVWTRPGVGPWTVELGGEAVVNTLQSRVELATLLPGGGSTPIDLPVDDATVRERRGEAFVNAGRSLGSNLRLDTGLTFEMSNLRVSGDANAARRLSYWKPRLTLDWRPSKWRAQLTVRRTVAQLQFQDFISSAELANERVNGGNPDLVPQRAWESLLTIERPILGDGLAKLELGYNSISQVQDRVPTPDGFDAPGNLGDGYSIIVRPRLDVPLGGLGVKGGRLTAYLSYVKTSVQDPYTLRDRPFTGNSAFYGETTFRQDLGKFAWGFTASYQSPFTLYRLNETDHFIDETPYVQMFAEYRPDAATTVNFTVFNALDRSVTRHRTFFKPDRRTATPHQLEVRERNQHVIPQLTVKRNFG